MAPTSWSRNKKLVLTWTALLVLFVASGVVLIVAAEVFRQGSAGELTALTLRRLVWTRLFSDGARSKPVVKQLLTRRQRASCWAY